MFYSNSLPTSYGLNSTFTCSIAFSLWEIDCISHLRYQKSYEESKLTLQRSQINFLHCSGNSVTTWYLKIFFISRVTLSLWEIILASMICWSVTHSFWFGTWTYLSLGLLSIQSWNNLFYLDYQLFQAKTLSFAVCIKNSNSLFM